MERIRPRSLFGSILLLAVAVSLHAQAPGSEIELVHPSGPQSPQSPADFGTRINILQIPAAAFRPRCSAQGYDYSGSGYIFASNNVCFFFNEVLWAPVTLPTGARILYLDLYFDDTDATNDITASLRSFSSGAGLEDITTVASSGSAGSGYASSPLIAYTVNNNVEYDVNGRMLTVLLTIPGATSALKVKGADVWWDRPVSPAPGTATFNDVPTDHPFFQYIEALSQSGITGGCNASPPLYCPNNPLTRGQMAVFLAKALGLSWYDVAPIIVAAPK